MVRLPTPGGDDGTWGDILNSFLEVSHNSDGSLKSPAVIGAGGVTSVNSKTPSNGAVSLTPSDVGALASNASAGGDLMGNFPDPTVVQLYGTPLDSAAPADGQVLTYSQSAGKWQPRTSNYVQYQIPASASQGWIANPTDQSALIQSAIDDAFNAGGGEVRLPAGVFYGSFQMRPAVDLVGSGWQTVLRAMPGQTNPVVDYSAHNAYHTRLSNIRIDGNYIYGRTDGVTQGACTGISLDTTPSTRTGFMFGNASYQPAPPGGDGPPFGSSWNDAANTINRVLVTACGGSDGIYLGINQNNTFLHDVFIYCCKNTAMHVNCTDSLFSNIQAGACGLGIYITQSNNKFVNCKSWYHGVNTGYTGQGHGWLMILPDATTYGGIQMTGCESQDNAGCGINFNVINGAKVKGFVSGGDSGAAIYLWNAQNCDIDFAIIFADRAQDTIGVYFASQTPQNNRIRWTMINNLPGLGTFTPYYFGTSGTTYNGFGNDVQGPNSQSFPLITTVNNTLTPTANKTAFYAAYTGAMTIANPSFTVPGAFHPGEELVIALCDSAGGHAVTWGTSYHGAAGFTTVANKWSTFKFIYLGSGYYALVSSQVNMT